MERIARFEKVSEERFSSDLSAAFSQKADECYKLVSLPKRATAGSAGYDFIAPFDICLAPGQSLRVPTGIRCAMAAGWVLMIFPKSGLGFKFRVQLDNTVGIIDQDYYYADNEGHILIKITNDSKESKTLELKAGKAFAQGVFVPFGITEGDDAAGIRTGGFGSTGV